MKKINKIFLLTIVTFVFFTIFPISTSAWRKYVNDSTIPVTCKYKKYFYQSTGNTLENDNGNYNIYSITFEMKLLYGAKPYRAGTSNLEKAYPLEKQGNKYIINMTEKKGDFGPGVIENPHLSTDFVVEGGVYAYY